MNETLEAMARALFKSWFVDFDPVRAKAEGRDPGLPKPIADLFPDCLRGLRAGEIPERVASRVTIGDEFARRHSDGALLPCRDRACRGGRHSAGSTLDNGRRAFRITSQRVRCTR